MIARATVPILGLGCLAWMPTAQVPTFTSGVESVRVDVLVARDGIPVTGLTLADFDVRDNDVTQQIDRVAFEEIPLNVVLALDGSNSVLGKRAKELGDAGRHVLDLLKPDDQAALIAFGDALIVRSALTHDLAKVRTALDAPLPHGDTALVDASYAGLLLGESRPGRGLVIVFSDGVEVSSYLDPNAVLQVARRSDAVVYGVVIKGPGRPPYLHDLTRASGGELLEIESGAGLDAAFTRILDQFRHRYLLSYTPRGVERGGWHRLDVRVKPRGLSVKARPGYLRD